MRHIFRIYSKLIAKFMLRILPEKPVPPDLNKRPDENQYEYSLRVPLIEQPIVEQPKLNYRGKPMR
jgi:hypothetical protein